MMDFTIDPEYLTSVTIRDEWNTYTRNGRVPTAEELILIIQGKGECSTTSSVFEDAIPGVEAARKAGMKCVAVTTTNSAEAFSRSKSVV